MRQYNHYSPNFFSGCLTHFPTARYMADIRYHLQQKTMPNHHRAQLWNCLTWEWGETEKNSKCCGDSRKKWDRRRALSEKSKRGWDSKNWVIGWDRMNSRVGWDRGNSVIIWKKKMVMSETEGTKKLASQKKLKRDWNREPQVQEMAETKKLWGDRRNSEKSGGTKQRDKTERT